MNDEEIKQLNAELNKAFEKISDIRTVIREPIFKKEDRVIELLEKISESLDCLVERGNS